MQETCLVERDSISEHGVSPMRIDLSEVGRPKLSPLIVTTVPPAVGPLGTERDLMMGHTSGSVHSFRFEASPSLCPFPESSESFPLSSDPFETARSGEDLDFCSHFLWALPCFDSSRPWLPWHPFHP